MEKQYIFNRSWILAGHVNDIEHPKNYLTLDLLGERYLIVRGHDHSIYAFHNVCRHRGSKLVDHPKGQCENILVCAFHGWSYQLDGKRINIPAEATFNNPDKGKLGLIPVRHEVWMGFLFVSLSNNGPSMKTLFQPVEDKLRPYQLENIQPIENTEYLELKPCNWKVIHDIDNEGYHIPMGHPTLQQLYGKFCKDTLIENIPISFVHVNKKSARLWSAR